MKKLLTYFSIVVILLFTFSVFGWVIKEVTLGRSPFGDRVNYYLDTYVSFLDLFEESVEEVKTLPRTFVPTPQDFERVNKLEEPLYALISYTSKKKERTVEIRDLASDSVFHQWKIANPFEAHDRIMDPLLLPNKSLCFSYNGKTGLTKLDSAGNVLWKQDQIAHHHSLNVDSAGHIWACSYTREKDSSFIIFKGRYELDSREIFFIDNTISRLHAETGEVLFHKSITEILKENGLSNLLLKSDKGDDPIHLNDVQPALKTTPYYQEGDLFLSFRNLSAILHYRPETNKVLQVLEGMFYSQHDVDFLNDSVIYFFNNNAHTLWVDRSFSYLVSPERLEAGNFHSNVITYDLKNQRYSYLYKEAFGENQIYTYTEGMSEMLNDSLLFVEEQNSGILWVLKNQEVVYKNALPSQHAGHHHLPNWTRILHNYKP